MVSNRWTRRLLRSMGASLLLLVVSSGSALAGDAGCEVQVSPLAAAAGSVFVFSGSGHSPTELTLQKEGSMKLDHDIDLGDADPWEVTVRSRVGDEGKWTAWFSNAETGCTTTVKFRVTLSSTDLIDDIVAATTELGSAPIGLYLAVIVVGFSGGLLIGRRVYAKARA